MSSTIISNTSPLIALSAIDDFELLPQIFASVLIPHAVQQEISATATLSHVKVPIEQALRAGWMELVSAPAGPTLSELRDRLGAGEAEAIALAVERRLPILMDDLPGRRSAADLSLIVTGTLGVLARSKYRGIIQEVKPRIQRLRNAGIFLSDELIERFLRETGEA